MNPVLQMENFCFGYKKELILKDISFTIDRGEFISIIGPNGSGKTTLIKAVSKYIAPRQGGIYLNGDNIQNMSGKKLAKNVAVVMQSADPVAMNVEDYVLLGRLPFLKKYQFFDTRKDIEIANRYMALTDILKLKTAKMSEISGGERQLASIARALTQSPSLLLLDEPTSHLDITHQVQILDLISSLQQELSLTVLMVLHDLNLAAEYSDRLILLNSQKTTKKVSTIFKTGTPEEVITESSIHEVYNTRVLVNKNPVSKKPSIFIVKQNS
ncbi:MAG: ABC transporter ATP-binding protein [Desulfobacula sp.]|nr:ABC transporter ATP-binding protein [Desulfobacula sp.]